MQGVLRKMRVELNNPVHYFLPVGTQEIALNPLLDTTLQFSFTGVIYCTQCQRKIFKSYQQGYCFPCFQRLLECNMCLLHPERCRFYEGHCDPNDWAHSHCAQGQIIYLANSSGLKVGITRDTHIPTRWIDQGATQGLAILHASNRVQAGRLEVAFKALVQDKTQWRQMLSGVPLLLDLPQEWSRLSAQLNACESIRVDYPAAEITPLALAPVQITYPVLAYPSKVNAINIEKNPQIQGRLLGIKGQYLLLDTGVLNIRKYAGYEIKW